MSTFKNTTITENLSLMNSDETKNGPTIPNVQKKFKELENKVDTKGNLTDSWNSGLGFYYHTIDTDYEDRVECMKDTLVNRPELWEDGILICHIISPSDDRGMCLVLKKTNPDGQLRLAFQYWDYWGANECWRYTSAGWQQTT